MAKAKMQTSLIGRRVRVTMGNPMDWIDGVDIEGVTPDVKARIVADRHAQTTLEKRKQALHEPWRYFWQEGEVVNGTWTVDGGTMVTVCMDEDGRMVDLFCSHLTVMADRME
jgi:hypothetical protein